MNIARNNEILRTTIDQDGILRLTLNNQHNHNALSEEMMSNIQVALEESINNKKIRTVIISAEGPTFSAGHDLGTPENIADQESRPYEEGMRGIYKRSTAQKSFILTDPVIKYALH